MVAGLDELVDLGHGVKATHATVDFLHSLNPREAWAVIATSWPGSALASMGPGDVWEAIEETHRKICRFHSTDGKCVHTMFEPRVVPCEEAPQGAGAKVPREVLARGARVSPRPRAPQRRTLLGLPWLQTVGILCGIAVSAAVVAGALAQVFG